MPPGNNKDNDTWTPKRPQKPEIKLTPGKGAQDLTCSMTDLIQQVVTSNKVRLSLLLPVVKKPFKWLILHSSVQRRVCPGMASYSLFLSLQG